MDVLKRTFWDDLLLREDMKAAVREALGSHRADELFPQSTDTIKIRRPVRYEVRTKDAK